MSKNLVESHADAFIGRPAQFPTERTDQELLGRPVARYSAVVVFQVVGGRYAYLLYLLYPAKTLNCKLSTGG